MILNRNHKYKKGFFPNKNNYTPKKILAFGLSISIFAGTLMNLGLNINHFSIEHLVQTDNYFIKNAVVSQVYDEHYDQQETLDHQITIEELEKVKQLRVSPSDMNILQYCKSLEKLEVTDCDFITDDMLLCMNQFSNLKEISFTLKSTEVFLENPEYKIDLDKLTSDVSINISFVTSKGIENDGAFLILSALKDSELTKNRIENNKIFFKENEFISLREYVALNNKLNEMITNCHFTEKTTDNEKMVRLIQATTDLIQYDSYIKEYNFDILLHREPLDVTKKVFSYNVHPISTVLCNNGDGVCTNYANIFTILAYKCGMEAYNLTIPQWSHMVNLVKLDGIYRVMDLTQIDNCWNSEFYPNVFNEYLKTKNEEDLMGAIAVSNTHSIESIDDVYKTKMANNYREHSMEEEIEDYQLQSFITEEKTFSEETAKKKENENKILIKYDGTSFTFFLPFELMTGIAFSAYLMKILEKEITINTAYLTKCKGLKQNKQLTIMPTKLPVGCTTFTQEKKENGQTKDILFISKQDTLERFFSSKNKKRYLQEKKTTWHPNLINATLQDYHTFLFPCDSLEDTVTFIKKNKKVMNKADHTIIIEENEKYSFETIQEVFGREDIFDRVFYKQKTNDKIIPILEKEKVNCKRMKRKYC